MTSTVACIGFTNPGALAAIVREHGEPFHELSSTAQWVDSSGAIVLLDRASQIARPGFLSDVRTPYSNVVALESGLAQVHVTDVSGAVIEPITVVPAARYTVGWAAAGRLALIAFGLDTEFFATAEDFFDSPRSALPGSESEPPPEVRQFGLPWPPPMEIESFLPHPQAATATLSGTVQFAEVRTNSLTHHEFLVARLSTLFGEIDLCTPVPVEGAPSPGAVVVGTVEMIGVFPAHGEPDLSTYAPQHERVHTTFRDVQSTDAGSSADLIHDDADVALPDGLVLGDDGMVRTEEEHRAWKNDGRSTTSTEAPHPSTADAPATPSTDAPAAVLPGENAPAQAAPDTADDLPRPGETRREWRTRTGRV